MKNFIFLLLLPIVLLASFDTFEEDPTLVEHVNVITGQLNLSVTDFTLQGPEPLSLTRSYSSSGALERDRYNWDLSQKKIKRGWSFDGGWKLLPHMHFYFIVPRINIEGIRVFLPEKTGRLITYTYLRNEKNLLILESKDGPLQGYGKLSGKTNPRNNRLELDPDSGEATVYFPDGRVAYFKGARIQSECHSVQLGFYRILKEVLPSKRLVEYTYDKNRALSRISLNNPSGTKTYSTIWFKDYHRTEPTVVTAEGCDGRTARYAHIYKKKGREYLYSVKSNCRPTEIFDYESSRKGKGVRVKTLKLAENDEFVVTYNRPKDRAEAKLWLASPEKIPAEGDKVAQIEAPVGEHGELVVVANFEYFPHMTEVRDSEGVLTRFHHKESVLEKIESFDRDERLYTTTKLYWEDQKLVSKVKFDARETPLLAKTFCYDQKGNVVEERLYGNISGESSPLSVDRRGRVSGGDCFLKEFTYDEERNLPLTEKETGGISYVFEYLPETNLLTSKKTYFENNLLVTESLFYDEDHLLIEKRHDDGNICLVEKIENDPDTGLPIKLTEGALDDGTFIPHHSQIIHYDDRRRVERETFCDEEEAPLYTKKYGYNDYDQLIYSTTPEGRENFYTYNSDTTLRSAKEAGGPLKEIEYDKAHRPILTRVAGTLTTSCRYNAKGQLISETDRRGNTTTFTYDAFGRKISSTLPQTIDENGEFYLPEITFTYDVLHNLASYTNPKGETKHTRYNILGRPIEEIAPDGQVTTHCYTLTGDLSKTTYPDYSELHYTYAPFQRVKTKTHTDSKRQVLKSEHYEYKGLLLHSYQNPLGLITTYGYDRMGKKVLEDALGRTTTFKYDLLGNVERITQGGKSSVTRYNFENELIETFVEDCNGTIENHVEREYDDEGRLIFGRRYTDAGIALDAFLYDLEGRLIQHTDPLGAITSYEYIETSYLKKITTDPLGNREIETYDPLERLIEIQKEDPEKQIVSKEVFTLDRGGNRVQQECTVFDKEETTRTYTVEWEYDSCARPIKVTEEGKKTTLTEYDEMGRPSRVTLPNGTKLTTTCDPLGRKLSLKSSDQTLHYTYRYEKGLQPTLAIDQVRSLTWRRSYNLFGELTSETAPNGHTLHWEYDPLGRCTSFTLPDKSAITYTYTPLHLETVSRPGYCHTYTQFSSTGHVTEEALPFQLGLLSTHHDLLERVTSQASPHLQNSITYGPSGLVTETSSSLFGPKTYAYDPLNQLKQEKETSYHFDSLGNPTDCVTNSLNQIINIDGSLLYYDLNGNPIRRHYSDTILKYYYDALNRLIQLNDTHYTYDPFDRLYEKDGLYYLHNQETEVGTYTEDAVILELRVLGLGIQSEIGAAIAIELDSRPFVPLHDLRGNIVALLNPSGELVDTYEYDAFGGEIELHTTTQNPWRFQSRRHDGLLIHFSKRFYDPSLKRFLTPDPSGPVDSPNLYLFVLNSPLNRLDLYGLSSAPLDLHQNILRNTDGIYSAQQNFIFRTGQFKPTDILHAQFTTGDVTVNVFIQSENLHQLSFTPKETADRRFDFLNHFGDLLSSTGSPIGLSTLGTGICNNPQDALEAFHEFSNLIPGSGIKVLFHTMTRGAPQDIMDTFQEILHTTQRNRETIAATQIRQLVVAFSEGLHKVNPEAKWYYSAHSRFGATTNSILSGMTDLQKRRFHDQVHLAAFGPAWPLAKENAQSTMNYYSHGDSITGWFGGFHTNNSNFEIKWLPVKSTMSQMTMGFADHKLFGGTYKNAQAHHIDRLQERVGFFRETR